MRGRRRGIRTSSSPLSFLPFLHPPAHHHRTRDAPYREQRTHVHQLCSRLSKHVPRRRAGEGQQERVAGGGSSGRELSDSLNVRSSLFLILLACYLLMGESLGDYQKAHLTLLLSVLSRTRITTRTTFDVSSRSLAALPPSPSLLPSTTTPSEEPLISTSLPRPR